MRNSPSGPAAAAQRERDYRVDARYAGAGVNLQLRT